MDPVLFALLSSVLHLQAGAVATPPSTADVIAGNGPSGAVATTSGSFATAASGSGTAVVTSLMPATNYTVSPAQSFTVYHAKHGLE